MGTWAERVASERQALLVPRETADAWFDAFLANDARRLLCVEGPPGSGKSILLERYRKLARDDARIGDGGVAWLSAKARPSTQEAWVTAFDPAARIILLDDFEALLPMLPFVLGSLMPSLGDEQKLVVAGRRTLPAMHDPGWSAIVTRHQLAPLSADESELLLARAGVPEPVRAGLRALAAGHPLALRVMASDWDGFDWRERHEARHAFLRRMLDGVHPAERQVLEVAALNRVVTTGLLERIKPTLVDAFHSVTALSLTVREAGGLSLMPVLREPLAQELAYSTPDLRDSILRASLAHAEEQTRVGPRERRVFWATNSVELIGRALRRGSSVSSTGGSVVAAREEHVDEVSAAVETHLGSQSAGYARQWLTRQPRGARLVFDAQGLIAYIHFLDLACLEATDVAEDPVVAAFALHARETEARRARLARFYLPVEERGLGFIVQETTAELLFGVDLELAGSAQPDRFLDRYQELATHPKVARLEVDGEPWSVSAEDLRRYTPADLHRIWSQICQNDPQLLGAAEETVSRFDPEQAYAELRRTLRAFHDPRRLARSPLAHAGQVRRLVASGEEPDLPSALRRMLHELVTSLGETGVDGQARRVLEASYFRPPRKQLAIARELGVGESTYRRHLKLALERLAERWLESAD